MQKKKNAFTLIELLAVIVILAIIALIAVPVILNIIDKANESAFKDSAYGIIQAGECYYTANQLDLDGPLEDVTMTTTDPRLELKGEIPEGNVIITRDGDIAIAIHNDRYCITKGYKNTELKIKESYESCNLPGKPLSYLATTETGIEIPNCIMNNEICNINEENLVAIKVDDTTVQNFYVIADDGEKITLIMDRNIGDNIRWYDDTDTFGTFSAPFDALNHLNDETSHWTNIPAMGKYIYDNNLNGTKYTSGYQKLEITAGTGILLSQDGTETSTLIGTSRARLLTYEEYRLLKNANNSVLPSWIFTNLLGYDDEEIETDLPYGYWILTGREVINSHTINGNGSLSSANWFSENFGVRPVI